MTRCRATASALSRSRVRSRARAPRSRSAGTTSGGSGGAGARLDSPGTRGRPGVAVPRSPGRGCPERAARGVPSRAGPRPPPPGGRLGRPDDPGPPSRPRPLRAELAAPELLDHSPAELRGCAGAPSRAGRRLFDVSFEPSVRSSAPVEPGVRRVPRLGVLPFGSDARAPEVDPVPVLRRETPPPRWGCPPARPPARRGPSSAFDDRSALIRPPARTDSLTSKTERAAPEGRPFQKSVRRRPTLPHSRPCSTIGAEGLSFRVRNGAGRFPFAMTAVTLWRCQSDSRPYLGNRTVDA